MFFFFLLCQLVAADIYMHSPPGTNDRNRERQQNRQNGNRLFDSQNNAAGGYPWRGDPTTMGEPDPMVYYSGSKLYVEWTSQHGCGPHTNLECDVILQYSCNDIMPGLRDGYPVGDVVKSDNNGDQGLDYQRREFLYNGNDGTDRIPHIVNDNNNNNDYPYGDCYERYGPGSNTPNEDQYQQCLTNLKVFYNGEWQGPNYSQDPTDTNTWGLKGVEYGVHESLDYYESCRYRERNRGLFIADRNVNGDSARYTRQNNNGGRNGLECAEERDYYPYWGPTPWIDVAVFVSDIKQCGYYVDESQNVKPKWYCECDEECRAQSDSTNNLSPITKSVCEKVGGLGAWRYHAPWKEIDHRVDKPDCLVHPLSRDNHLGNAYMVDSNGRPQEVTSEGPPSNAFYVWTVPEEMEDKQCVIRLRYNTTTADFYGPNSKNPEGSAKTHIALDGESTETFVVDSSYNCKKGSPGCKVYDEPYEHITDESPWLSIKFNTDQMSRTFQDRSQVFNVEKRPDGVPSTATIWNLNVRGRRGNIVQTYPAVEYDFVPNPLTVDQLDYVHVQLHFSDFNRPDNGNGEGWRYSDASNLVQIDDLKANFPRKLSQSTLFPNLEDAVKMAFLGTFTRTPQQHIADGNNDGTEEEVGPQYTYKVTTADKTLTCGHFYANNQQNDGLNENDEDNSMYNCGKLNHRDNLFSHMMKVDHSPGDYYYASTRNNNFSNRSHKGTITVSDDFRTTVIVVGVGLGAVLSGVLAFAGVKVYAHYRPASGVAESLANFGRSDASHAYRPT